MDTSNPKKCKIYTKNDMATFLTNYPQHKNSILSHLLQGSSSDYVQNVQTTFATIGSDQNIWGISLNEKPINNALICSPHTTYIEYPLDIVHHFDKMWVRALIKGGTRLLDGIARIADMEKTVIVNSNLNSLTYYPDEIKELLPSLTETLIHTHPKHSVLFFRINELLNRKLLPVFLDNNYLVFPDRKVHLYLPDTKFMKRRNVKGDLAILRKTRYTSESHESIAPGESARIQELYQQLFIKKHSKFNPIYTGKFFQQSIKHHWHDYTVLRNPTGEIDAFISWFYHNNIMICGPLGYDIELNGKEGLYRMLIALSLKHADENRLIFNMGAGADTFKSRRGSQTALEYTAVYCAHLPLYRHTPWRTLHWINNKILSRLFKQDIF